LGFVRGHGSAFAPAPTTLADALKRASEAALADAGSEPSALALVSSGASGLERDAAEAHGLVGLLGARAAEVPLFAVKANLGDPLDAGGALQTLAALEALRTGRAPGIPELEEPDVLGLGYANSTTAVGAGSALVTAISQAGACSALVVSGPDA
jgi:3-oxoacyl-(acyl-carrier-protein) synthase